MSFSRWSRVLVPLALCALAWSAHGAVDVTIANNTQVRSQLVNPNGVQRYRVYLPAGAKLSAAVKGKKDKKAGLDAPVMRMRLLDEFEDDVIADGFLEKAKLVPKGTGAKAKVTVEDSGEYIVEVFSEGGELGAFTLSVKWNSPKKAKIKDELFFDGDETDVEVSVDDDALLTMSVKKAGRSSAQPFFDRIEGDFFDQELDKTAKIRNVRVLEPGDLYVVIGNTSGEGSIGGSVKVKAPKTKRSVIPITPVAGNEKKVTGKVASPAKDVLIEADDEDIVGEEIVGASVLVPAGALSQPTSVQIGTSEPLPPPTPDAGIGAGPTVFFGPPGLQFETPVTVTIPYDADVVGDNTESLSVYTSDEDGNVEEIEDISVDVEDESVSFQASHFSSFRVFLRGVVPGDADFDGDGLDDLVLPAPAANSGAGRVYMIFSGGPPILDDPADTSQAHVTIAGASGEGFGSAYAAGDVNGDGRPDLLVLADGVQDGACFVFTGGPGFSPTSSSGAAFRFDGASGFGGMNSVAAGDVNGDGVDDIVVGGESGPNGAGAVVVWFGGGGLTSATTAAADLTFTGEQTGDLFGAAVEVGDVNGDDVPDLIVGADMIDNPGRTGAAYVQFGGSGIQGSPAASMDVVIAGSGADAGFGLNLAVGDVTGDQVGDLIVSEFDDDLGGPGAVYVFAGGTSFGPTSTSSAAGVFRGTQDEVVGSSLRVGDISGDGTLDLIVGARGASSGDGAIYIFDGGSSILGANATVGTPDITGPGFFEGFPLLARPLRGPGSDAIVAFAPGNEDGGIAAGAAYLFLDPRGEGPVSTDDALFTIYGQEDDSLGGELF